MSSPSPASIGSGSATAKASVLVAVTERNAEMESIFSGYKFVPDELVDMEVEISHLRPRQFFKLRKIHRNRHWDR